MNLISPRRAAELTDRFSTLRLLVVGDLMLDHWVWGSVARISPEAPIPVVEVERDTYTPGGAANVAINLRTLGARVEILGVVGADLAGRRLRGMLRRRNVGTGGIQVTRDRPTTLKTRIIAHAQQVVRADLEARIPLGSELEQELVSWIRSREEPFHAVLLSDYAKGVFGSALVEELGRALPGVPRVAGPKPANLDNFRGVDLVVLNAREARAASRCAHLERAGQILLERLGGGAVLITRGGEGMALFQHGRPLLTLPALASQVYDVSGAGDTVLAVMGLSCAAGASLEEAARLAAHAAGVVVRKVGTAAVDPEELLASIRRFAAAGDTGAKVVGREELRDRLDNLRRSRGSLTVVFTNGCFDLLHVGHLRTLREARRLGDLLVVGLNSDASVRRLKGGSRPVVPLEERAELLAGLECVDYVVPFEEDTPIPTLQVLRPEVHVKGGDYRPEDLPEAEVVRSWGGRVVVARRVPGRSTTQLVERLRDGDPALHRQQPR